MGHGELERAEQHRLLVEARHAHKTQARQQDGFKAHPVMEPDTGLATRVRLTQAAGADTSDAGGRE